jgi:UDP-3-O-[3-hydroxymyristoyl] glucosamine N-acyltransferase
MEFTINQIAAMLNGEVLGDGTIKINTLKKIQEGVPGSLSFLSNPKYESFAYSTKASGLIVNKDFKPSKKIKTTLIKVEDPYLSFTVLLEEYHRLVSFQKTGVEEPSYLGENTKIGNNIYRGAFSYIGNEATIGSNVKIYPNSYIGDGVSIGDNTIIHAGVKVYPGCKIGSQCVLHSGVVIGSDGFGFAPQKDGSYKPIPQLGKVMISDFVHIGANTTIDCATMEGDFTIIGEGVKLDNLIQIAHNVKIGAHTVIAAQTGIAGSTSLGKYCILGGQVGIAGHLEIGDNVGIGAQSGLGKNVEAGTKLFGSPAFDLREYLSSYAVFKKLPDLNNRLKQLEEKILNLPTV